MSHPAQQLKDKALSLGFNLVGIIPAEPAPHLQAYFDWIENGMHGKMGYLARPDRQVRRQDLNVILDGVQSMVLVGLDYRASVDEQHLHDPSRGRIASYAWHMDYHDIITPRLEMLADWMQQTYAPHGHRVYVDTGAILERSHAYRAGMGFIGKNTMLIHPRRGSYFFLGEMLTTLTFNHYDTPKRETQCGSCTRCLNACPTDAFPKPYVLDARRCISYHTIENKDWIDHDLRGRFGNWIYGCDVCQDVCPWQRFTHTTHESDFQPVHMDDIAPPLLDLLTLSADGFRQRYRQSPIYRIKHHRFLRNVCIASGNWGDPQALPHLVSHLTHEQPIVRGHAAWAIAQIDPTTAKTTVYRAYQNEPDAQAKQDMHKTLSYL